MNAIHKLNKYKKSERKAISASLTARRTELGGANMQSLPKSLFVPRKEKMPVSHFSCEPYGISTEGMSVVFTPKTRRERRIANEIKWRAEKARWDRPDLVPDFLKSDPSRLPRNKGNSASLAKNLRTAIRACQTNGEAPFIGKRRIVGAKSRHGVVYYLFQDGGKINVDTATAARGCNELIFKSIK